MIKTFALICAVAMPRPDCQLETAYEVVVGPDAPNETACMFQTMAYAAHLSRTHPIPPDHYVKILCRRPLPDSTAGRTG